MLNELSEVIRIKEGDIKTFENVFKRFYSPLLYYSAGITGRHDIAEEIIQDVFYVIWRDRESLQIFKSLKSFLYTCVKNKSLQYCEHKKVVNTHEEYVASNVRIDSEAPPDEGIEAREMERVIMKTIEKMPERRVKIFKMHRFEDKKYTEIADILSLSVKTVEAEMTKALKSLRKEIELHKSLL